MSRQSWLGSRSLKKALIAFLLAQIVCLLLWTLSWPQSVVNLSFLVNPDEGVVWEPVIERFHATHPNIRINLVTNPDVAIDPSTTDGRSIIYEADFQNPQTQYDLVYMDVVWTAPFAEHLRDLTPLVEQDNVDLTEFLDSEIRSGTLGDKLYRMPMYTDIGLLYYRKDWLEAVGLPLPNTLASLAETVAAMKASAKVPMMEQGYLWQGLEYEGLIATFVELLAAQQQAASGATVGGQSGRYVSLDNPDAAAAADLLVALVDSQISPAVVTDLTERLSVEMFREGRSAFLRGWPNFWTEIMKEPWGSEVAIAPPFSFTQNPGRGCRGGWGFGIPVKSTHPDEAWEAIKYFTSEEVQRIYVQASGSLPTRRSLFNDAEIVAKYPLMPQMINYLEHSSVFRPMLENYNEASILLQSALADRLSANQVSRGRIP